MVKLELINTTGFDNIKLNNNHPTTEDINPRILLLENYRYKLRIITDLVYDSIEIYIGDYAIDVELNEFNGCLETIEDTIFLGCFDLTFITININNLQGEEIYYYSEYICVATTKETSQQIQCMLEEIEQCMPNFLNICFSKSRKRAGLESNKVKSIWNTIKQIEEIGDIFDQNLPYFVNYLKGNVKTEVDIIDIHSIRNIDETSLRWIIENPALLKRSMEKTSIRVRNKYYSLDKIKAEKTIYSYNVYENQVIIGFLKSLWIFIEVQINNLEEELLKLSIIPQEVVLHLPNTHELTNKCIYVFYKGIINKLLNCNETIKSLYFRYKNVLKCESLDIEEKPKLTNTFKSIKHYRLCYEEITKWYETGDYVLDHLEYIFKLKTLSRIFEYYCLIKLQNALHIVGYQLHQYKRIDYFEGEEGSDNEYINNFYEYDNGVNRITLYYEPVIFTDRLTGEIGLYSTGFNFIKNIENTYWTPDFLLKVSNEKDSYYYILDAKFSSFKNVKTRYMSELILKYGVQIASINKFFSEVVGVGTLYPNDKGKYCEFKRNKILSTKRSFPIYFSLSVDKDNHGTLLIAEKLNQLLGYINNLSNDLEDSYTITENNIDEVLLENKTDSNIKIEGNFNQEKTIIKQDDAIELQKLKLTNKGNKNTNYRYERSCQYNTNMLCVLTKNICSANGNKCSNYEKRNSLSLKKGSFSCKYYSNSRCSIIKEKGCVGINKCKFYKTRKEN